MVNDAWYYRNIQQNTSYLPYCSQSIIRQLPDKSPTLIPLTTTSKLKFSSLSPVDDEIEIKLKGLDVYGHNVTETITLQSSKDVISDNHFSRLLKVEKPQTTSAVHVHAMLDDEWIMLSVYTGEHYPAPSYTAYTITAVTNKTQSVNLLVKKKLLPIRNDDSELLIANVDALMHGMLAARYFASNNPDLALNNLANAERILNNELATTTIASYNVVVAPLAPGWGADNYLPHL